MFVCGDYGYILRDNSEKIFSSPNKYNLLDGDSL